jgi:uncharacterized RDD family membrane protein YckC
MHIYISNGQQRLGPYTPEEIARRLASGELMETALAWHEGLTSWVPLSDIVYTMRSSVTGIPLPPTLPSVSYAGFWKRLAAILIDYIIMFVVTFVIGYIVGLMLRQEGWTSAEDVKTLCYLIGILAIWLYFSSLESSSLQGTVGKLALGIKVTTLKGQRISFARATGRYFAKFLSGLILGVGFLMAGFTKKKQALHDMMAECIVVDK